MLHSTCHVFTHLLDLYKPPWKSRGPDVSVLLLLRAGTKTNDLLLHAINYDSMIVTICTSATPHGLHFTTFCLSIIWSCKTTILSLSKNAHLYVTLTFIVFWFNKSVIIVLHKSVHQFPQMHGPNSTHVTPLHIAPKFVCVWGSREGRGRVIL